MGKTSTYESKIPDARGLISYTDAENAVWRDLYARQKALLPGRACRAFVQGIDLLELPHDRVPQLAEVNDRLQEVSGFGLVPAALFEGSQNILALKRTARLYQTRVPPGRAVHTF